jgi:hypothetical protein
MYYVVCMHSVCVLCYGPCSKHPSTRGRPPPCQPALGALPRFAIDGRAAFAPIQTASMCLSKPMHQSGSRLPALGGSRRRAAGRVLLLRTTSVAPKSTTPPRVPPRSHPLLHPAMR